MNRYPDNEWQEILGNCDVQVALGCTDELTATHLSSRTGEVTIGVSSTGKMLSSWQVSNYTPQYRETSSVGKRKLLTMDEVLRMPLEKELVIIRGQKVLMLDKFDYTEHFESKKLLPFRATDYIPQWSANEYFQERTRRHSTAFSPEEQPPPPANDASAPEPAADFTGGKASQEKREPRYKPGKSRHKVRQLDEPPNQETLY